MIKIFKVNNKCDKGFTLVEIMVSVGIFAFLTAFLLAKYGTFNQGTLLTNTAYDVALTIRNAQSYGINIKSDPLSGGDNFSGTFTGIYGVHFDKRSTGSANTKIIFFKDINDNGLYDSDGSEDISTSIMKRGTILYDLSGSGGSSCFDFPDYMDITFKRPDPNAIIIGNGGTTANKCSTGEIVLKSSDGGTKAIMVRSTGQIAVEK